MKNIDQILRLSLTIFFTFAITYYSYCDPPPPPGEGGSGRTSGNVLGAPIDGGFGILLAMGGAYGARKLYKARKDKKEKEKAEKEDSDNKLD